MSDAFDSEVGTACTAFIILTPVFAILVPIFGPDLITDVLTITGFCLYLVGGLVITLATLEGCWFAANYIAFCLLVGFKPELTRWGRIKWFLKLPYYFVRLVLRFLFTSTNCHLSGPGWEWKHPGIPRRKA